MDKNHVWMMSGISIILAVAVLILLVISLSNVSVGGGSSDSSGIPMGTFFVIFVLPGIIAVNEKKKKEQAKLNQITNQEVY